MKSTDYWVDLAYEAKEGTFVWDSGHILLSSVEEHWNVGEPTSRGVEDCVKYSNGGLIVVPCSSRNKVVCQKGKRHFCYKKPTW